MNEEEILDIMSTQLPDTTPERILINRSGGEFLLGKTSKGSVIKGYKVKSSRTMNSKDKELDKLVYDYTHYFDKGYLSEHSIDDLPRLIKERCEQNIRGRA